jgi:hypothetical protein
VSDKHFVIAQDGQTIFKFLVVAKEFSVIEMKRLFTKRGLVWTKIIGSIEESVKDDLTEARLSDWRVPG